MKTTGAYTEESEKFKAKNEKLLNSEVLHFSFYTSFSIGPETMLCHRQFVVRCS